MIHLHLFPMHSQLFYVTMLGDATDEDKEVDNCCLCI